MEDQNQSPEKVSKLPKWLTTVTLFSKLLAMFLFILFPFAGFYLGMKYQQQLTVNAPVVSQIQKNGTPTPTVSNKSGTKYNIDKYFSITYPKGWVETKDGCSIISNISVAGQASEKQLSNAGARSDICVYLITSQSGNTFTFRFMKARASLGETSDQSSTFTTNKVINGDKAYTTETISDLRNSNLPGLSSYVKDTYILHGKYVYSIHQSVSLSNRTDNIEVAKQSILPDFNQIIDSISFNPQ